MRQRHSARFPIVVAADDSSVAADVLRATVTFPWPAAATAHGVVATGIPWMVENPADVRAAFTTGLRKAAATAERTLKRRWPGATVRVVNEAPVPAILSAAEALDAKTIVVGWRGHGLVHRMFSGGSVSRGVVRGARRAVLVVKGRPRDVRRIVVGVDGSPCARAAVRYVSRLDRGAAITVTLVTVVPSQRMPSLAFLPAEARAMVVRGARAAHDARVGAAQRELDRLVPILQRRGFKVDSLVRFGAPIPELLPSARDGDLVVVGARGAGGLEGLLLGSVADGAVRHAPRSVLVVR